MDRKKGEGPVLIYIIIATHKRYDKSTTSKIYTTWALILSARNIFCTQRREETTAGSNAPGAFLFFLLLLFLFSIYMADERDKTTKEETLQGMKKVGEEETIKRKEKENRKRMKQTKNIKKGEGN